MGGDFQSFLQTKRLDKARLSVNLARNGETNDGEHDNSQHDRTWHGNSRTFGPGYLAHGTTSANVTVFNGGSRNFFNGRCLHNLPGSARKGRCKTEAQILL